MFNFGNIFSPRTYLGIDIGTTSIKAIEIDKGNGKPKLKNYGILESYGHLERVNNSIQTGSLKIVENDTVDLLKMLLNKANFSTREAIVSIPAFAAFVTLLEIPQMKEDEVERAMRYQLGQYIPLPVSEVEIEWIKAGQRQDQQGFVKDQILLISVPKDFIEGYKKIFQAAGLNLRALEVESISLLRSIYDGVNSPTLVVDIGARSTNIIITEQGSLKYSYQTDMASASLTQALAKGLGVNIKRAEKLKKDRGFVSGAGSEISTLMIPYLDAILNEVRRAKDKYEQNFDNKIERIILTGGGSIASGIAEYVSSQFNLPTVVGDPFAKISYPEEILPIVKKIGPNFSVAIGLGIKDFVK